jgi:hypothetical protein
MKRVFLANLIEVSRRPVLPNLLGSVPLFAGAKVRWFQLRFAETVLEGLSLASDLRILRELTLGSWLITARVRSRRLRSIKRIGLFNPTFTP